MKADNTITGHNRTIRITGIPDPKGEGFLPELTITVNYVQQPNEGGSVYKAVTLDGVVIPAIIEALNKG